MVSSGSISAGAIGAIATFILLVLEMIMLPMALNILLFLNDSDWLSSGDRSILANSGTITVVTVLFTFIGGMIGSIFLALQN